MTPATTRRPAIRRAMLNGLLIFLIGVFAARLPTTLAQISGRGEFIDTVGDVYQSLMSSYVDVPDAAKLQKGAIDGMLEALNDDYAAYVPEEDVAMFDKEMTGHFSGIGCQIEIRDGWLTVVSPMEDSPAFNAGIMAGDRIIKIGEKSTFKLNADECIKLLTGEAGTPVTFTVQREGAEMPFTLIRAPITSKTVRGVTRDPRGGGAGKWNFIIDPEKRVAYLRLSQFTPTAAEELVGAIEAAFEQAGDAGLGGMILDLRNNPGGVMDGALAIADLFLENGQIMSIRGRTAPPIEFAAEADGTLPEFPLVVMVNGGSASASEIVAGSLQDRGRAKVIGTRTYGKGLVQTVARLRHAPKAELKFTTQRYYLPSGRSIQRSDDSAQWGVDPDEGFYVPMTDREQLDALLKRRDWDILRKMAAAAAQDPAAVEVEPQPELRWHDADWVEQTALDKQLAAALRAVQARIAEGTWKPVSDATQEHGKLAISEVSKLQEQSKELGLEFARIEKRLTALRKQAETNESTPEKVDLWADAIDPTGGRVDIFDKEGKRIAKLSVTGRDLERWLLNADVEPSKNDADAVLDPNGSTSPPASPTPGSMP